MPDYFRPLAPRTFNTFEQNWGVLNEYVLKSIYLYTYICANAYTILKNKLCCLPLYLNFLYVISNMYIVQIYLYMYLIFNILILGTLKYVTMLLVTYT